MTHYNIEIKPKAGESLSPVVLKIEDKFPNINEFADKFIVKEGRKGFFASGYPKLIEIVLSITTPDQEKLEECKRLIEYIKELDICEVSIDSFEEE